MAWSQRAHLAAQWRPQAAAAAAVLRLLGAACLLAPLHCRRALPRNWPARSLPHACQDADYLASLEPLAARLNSELPGGPKFDRKALAQLFAGLMQFMEDALGVNVGAGGALGGLGERMLAVLGAARMAGKKALAGEEGSRLRHGAGSNSL